MIRVVVADDESKVCQLICGLTDWAGFGMEIVGVAHNGVEALEMAQSLAPDLMVTDIRMPGCDGLEMIARARQLRSELDFIIISGYSHFEYAQSAIKYGVSDYLLKPIKKTELEATLGRMRDKYLARTARLSSEEQMKMRLQSDIGRLRSGLFRVLADPEDGIPLERANGDFHFSFQPGTFQMFVLKIDCAPGAEDGLEVLEEKAVSILRGCLAAECYEMELSFDESRAVGVLNYEPERRTGVRRLLKNALDELLVQTSVFEKLRLTIGLGNAVNGTEGLGESLGSSRRAAAQRLLEGTGKLIESAPPAPDAALADALLSELHKSLEPAVEVLDREGAGLALARLRDAALAERRFGGQELFALALGACRVYSVLLRASQMNTENIEDFDRAFARRADSCGSASELFAALAQAVEESLSAAEHNRRQAEKKPIRAAKQYIQERFAEPISLEQVADFAGFNASYFSTLFKKESGQNFQEYLSEVRMTRAKELLRDTKENVAAICEAVGYSDLKHFTQSFKKYTGLKPNEFRKLYS